MKTIVGILIIWSASAGAGGTFVGNGGGQGDVELAVTKKQITETFEVIKSRGQGQFCRCNPAFENRSVCEPLSVLTEEQRGYCSKVISEIAPEILKMIGPVPSVIVRWTNEPINVQERGQIRAVDAVTNREKREITINLKRFLQMQAFERVFLLTHELAHLTKIDGKPLEDEGSIGPFEGDEGGRRLLNAVGSSAAVMQGAYPREIRKYRGRLHRSQSWKPFWIEAHAGVAKFQNEQKQVFAADDFNRSGVNFRYQLGDLGFTAGYRMEYSHFKALDTITVKETKDIFSLGLAYRFFPFGDPLTFWGQTHFQIQALVDFVKARIRLTEDLATPFEEEKNTVGGSFSASYYVPLFWGIWTFAGVAYEVHPYKYSKLNVDYKDNLTSTFLGVGYAF